MCPRCKSQNISVLHISNGSNNVDNLPHRHLECNNCKQQFNQWECPLKAIKVVFGAHLFHLYQ